MDCDDLALLLAASGRTLTTQEDQQLHNHVAGCETCRELAAEAADGRFRWVARVPEDALDDPDFLVLPIIDPIVFGTATEIARGGMGRVSRAHDRRLGRNVAIKEVLVTGLRARFEREVAITAKLQHPAIVPVYEAGSWPSGTAFYTMRLVSGGTLSESIAKSSTLEDRLALLPHVTALTDAVAYAHSRRIVHRDLKPGNVLVGEFGETVVIDWGLAKELDVDTGDGVDAALAATSADLTVVGAVMGTPGFMAPEQAAGDEIDERCDVYALGAILYNVLSGRPPHWDTDTKPTPDMLVELARVRPPIPIGELAPNVPVDLRAIIDRAMARDPNARFATAKEMAEELRRFHAGQLLRSRDYRIRDLVLRWLRQHRAAVAVGAIAATILAVVGVAAIVGIARSRTAERAARQAAERALADSQLEQGRQILVAGNPDEAAPLIASALAQLPDDRVAQRLDRLAGRDAHRRMVQLEGGAAAFSADGRLVAAGRADGSIVVIDATTGATLRTLPPSGGAISDLWFSEDAGQLLAAGPTGATLRDARTGAIIATLATAAIREARFVQPDRVLLAGKESLALVARDGTPIASAVLREPHRLDVSRDGATILALTGSIVLVASVRDLSHVAELPHGEHTFDARFDHDGGVITAADDGGRRWGISPVRELGRLPWGFSLAWLGDDTALVGGDVVDLHTNAVRTIARDVTIQCNAAIDSHHVMTAGYDRVIRIWDLDRSALPIVAVQAGAATGRLTVESTRQRAVSVGAGDAGPVELWDLAALPGPASVTTLGGRIDHVETDRHGRQAVRWETPTGGRTDLFTAAHHRVATLEGWPIGFRPGGDETVTDQEGRLYVASAVDGHLIREIAEARPIYHIAYSASGALVATDADSRHVDVRSADSWTILHGFDVPSGVTALALDDADHLVTGNDDGTIRIWNVRTGALVRTVTGHTAHISSVEIRGAMMESSGWDLTARRWAFPSGDALGVLTNGHHLVNELALSPDGQLIAIADGTSVLTVWDSERGRLIQKIPTADDLVTTAFVDDEHLVVGGTGGRLEVIELAPARLP